METPLLELRRKAKAQLIRLLSKAVLLPDRMAEPQRAKILGLPPPKMVTHQLA
jgi:hypothetical protein